ncbi:glycosyltransferase [Corynebacterium nasicanis]|uniref:Glycosyltransferase n=1 Tax=Corynebacterium nasicanis TaxID=1448267 RepID=A0ABW1Q8X8_9CORY
MICHLIVGPDGHGVTEYARSLAAYSPGSVLRGHGPLPPGPVHVTFTDHLFGETPAAGVEKLLARCAGHPLSVSLHDIPQEAEGAQRLARRAPAYRELLAAADLAVVNSHHEATFFGGDVPVIPLPVPTIDSPYRPVPGTVGILGFLYPGKGHDDVLRAVAGTGLRVRALGGVSEGHAGYARQLQELAAELGVSFEITGWLSEADLAAEMGRIEIPVCAHRHYSASGSLMTWLGAGRTVLVSDSPYTREMAATWPGIRIVTDWPQALREFTPAPPTRPAGWEWAEVAAAWERHWRALWPRVSVVIPYYNNPAGLGEVIAGVQKQNYPGEVEIIVADDGSPVPPDVHGRALVVSQEDRGFRAAAARNLGADSATGEVLAFLDGDTVPAPGYLRAVVPHVHAEGRTVVVGSRLTGPERVEPQWLRDAWTQTGHLQRADGSSWRFIVSAALTCGRDFFRELGGFDATMVGYGGEDWEFGHRAWESGARFIHEPRAVAIHEEPDWGGRAADTGEKNAESIALAHRITHPLARPAGVIFDTADLEVHVPGWPDPGVTETVIIGWLRAGDVHVIIDPVPDLFRADPRVRAQAHGARRSVLLDAPVIPDSLPTTHNATCFRAGRQVARVRGRRREAAVEIEVTWQLIDGPRRLEREFAGW